MRKLGANREYVSKEIATIAALFFIALLVRLFFLQFRQVIGTDSYTYAMCGKSLIEGRGLTNPDGTAQITFVPLASMLIGLFTLIFNNLELAARLASVFAGSLLIVPLYLLSKKLGDRTRAILASLLAAFYPGLVNISTQVGSEALYAFLLVSMVYVLWIALHKRERGWVYFTFVGAMTGLCYLTRAVGALYLPIVCVWASAFSPFAKIRVRRALANVIGCLVAFLVVISPYLLFIHSQIGRVSLAPEAGSWLSMNAPESEEGAEIARTSISGKATLEIGDKYGLLGYFLKYPALFAGKFARNVFLLYKREVPYEIPPLVMIFIGLGLLGAPFRRERFMKDIFLGTLLLPILVPILWILDSRHVIPVIPFLLIPVSDGLCTYRDTFLASLKIGAVSRKALFAATVAVLILSLLPSTINSTMQGTNEPIEHKRAGLWLKKYDDSNPVVMSRKPWVSFYSGGIWICLPFGTYEEIIDYAYKNKVKYLVIDEMYVPKVRPQLVFLLDEKMAPRELEPVYRDRSGRRALLIYRLLDRPMQLSVTGGK